MNWSSRPFLRLLLFFVSGILTAWNLRHLLENVLLFLNLLLCFLLLVNLLLHMTSWLSWKFRHIHGLVLGLLIFTLGFWMTRLQCTGMYSIPSGEERYYCGKVVGEPVETEKAIKVLLSVREMNDPGDRHPDAHRVMAFMARENYRDSLQPGSLVAFRAALQKPDRPTDPYVFDSARFLALNRIYHTVFLREGEWQKLEGQTDFSIRNVALGLRASLLRQLSGAGLSGREFAVTSAILLGYDELMDEELSQDFRNAGAMHILCVSGLHVGIVYLVIHFIFNLLLKHQRWKYLRAALLMITIWSYALLTGLSPSVQRAGLMLTVFIIGGLTERERDAYNTLAASAMLMLVIDPLLIFNIGFQLSYAAVVGILAFHRPIYGLLYLKNKVLDKLWSVFVLSLAAQLGTFPLSVHYFHFFPTWFWLTNLFLFPLSIGIVATGFLFLVGFWIPYYSDLLGLVLSGLVKAMNGLVMFVEKLPGYGLDDLYFPWILVVLIYMLIAVSLQLFIFRRIRFLLPFVILVFGLAFYQFVVSLKTIPRKQLVISAIRGHTSIDFVRGEQAIVLADSVLVNDKNKFDYLKRNSLIARHLEYKLYPDDTIHTERGMDFYFDGTYGYFGKIRFAIWEGRKGNAFREGTKLDLDLLVLRGRKKVDLASLMNGYDFDLLVIDGSVPGYQRNRILKACEECGINYHDVRVDGELVFSAGENK
ncbi:MAG: ComEC/Rec2 family competence protein [bacterium]